MSVAPRTVLLRTDGDDLRREAKHPLPHAAVHGKSRARDLPPQLLRAIAARLEGLRSVYRADSCTLVFEKPDGTATQVRANGARRTVPQRLTPRTARVLLGPTEDAPIVYAPEHGGRVRSVCRRPGVRDGSSEQTGLTEWCGEAAAIIGTRCFLSVPCTLDGGCRGRLFVGSCRRFSVWDAAFVREYAKAIATFLGGIEEIVQAASQRERSRLSLDVHDTAIQPYIGLRMGLQSLYREVEDDELKAPIAELIAMTDLTIRDLRGYATDLKHGACGGEALATAIIELARRYERFDGVRVSVEIEPSALSPALGADIFQFVREGLSNIRRHSGAGRAFIRIGREAGSVRIQIGNEANGSRAQDFVPRSIEQRAHTLGGTVTVGFQDGYTLVSVSVPL